MKNQNFYVKKSITFTYVFFICGGLFQGFVAVFLFYFTFSNKKKEMTEKRGV
jgi:hypothetical protein